MNQPQLIRWTNKLVIEEGLLQPKRNSKTPEQNLCKLGSVAVVTTYFRFKIVIVRPQRRAKHGPLVTEVTQVVVNVVRLFLIARPV